jgi:hypothetical protein
MRLRTATDWLRGTRSGRITLGAAVAVVLAASVTGIVLATRGGGNASSEEPSVQADATDVDSSPTSAARATPTKKAAATPTVILPPGGPPDPGGDRPAGPPAAAPVGSLPENSNASGDFLALRNRLQSEIDAYHASTGTEVAFAVTDLQTDQTISVNGNRAQRTGCTIHLFALLAITGEFEAGRGDPGSVAASVRSGIGDSYPPNVRAFLDAVFGNFHRGEARAREQMASWGMTASLFDHVAYYGDGTRNNLLTALETNMVLTKLYRGQLFSGEWTSYALQRLHEIKPGLNYIIPGQLPPEASVAHKIGYYADSDGWVVADAGIVSFAGRGGTRTYIVTYLSQKAPSEPAGYTFGAELSKITWDWMYGQYKDRVPPTPTRTNTPRPPAPTATDTPRPVRTAVRTPVRTATPTRTPTPAATPVPSQ